MRARYFPYAASMISRTPARSAVTAFLMSPGDMSRAARVDDPVLGDDGGDEVGGSDVEGVVERPGSRRRGRDAEDVGDLFLRPLLHRDLVAAGRRGVDRRFRHRDDERY